jgi:hypothetical protein
MRHRVRAAPGPRRAEPAPPAGHPLAGLPNHALARVLARAPKPTRRTKVNEIKDLDAGIGAAEWARRLNANESVIPLYADLAAQIGTAGLRDLQAGSINKARNVEGVKPGLNFVSRGINKGRCWYIEDGKPVNALTVTTKGPLPRVAVGLAGAVFVPGNKAFALATLRHEIEHAAHRQMALDWLQQWRDKGAPGDFRIWLGTQAISQADRALVGELVEGSVVNTEVLAHLEGFILAFPHEARTPANAARGVYDQLVGLAEKWGPASTDVKQEAVARIVEFKKTQQGPALKALQDAFTRLKGEPNAPKELVAAVLSAP